MFIGQSVNFGINQTNCIVLGHPIENAVFLRAELKIINHVST